MLSDGARLEWCPEAAASRAQDKVAEFVVELHAKCDLLPASNVMEEEVGACGQLRHRRGEIASQIPSEHAERRQQAQACAGGKARNTIDQHVQAMPELYPPVQLVSAICKNLT